MSLSLFDAHAHWGRSRELEERCREGITSLISTTSKEEFQRILDCHSPFLIPTFGIHPMYAERYHREEIGCLLSQCRIIGEIGMDDIWCQVPLPIQEKVFREQLAFAAKAGKPVILHTKGQEKNIANIIKEYPNTYLVHWYSAPEAPKDFIDLDCYFSIGPDIWWNQAVRQTATMVPENRLLIETDGMDAVKWAYDEQIVAPGEPCLHPPDTIRDSLLHTLHHLALLLHKTESQTLRLVEENFHRFLNSAK